MSIKFQIAKNEMVMIIVCQSLFPPPWNVNGFSDALDIERQAIQHSVLSYVFSFKLGAAASRTLWDVWWLVWLI